MEFNEFLISLILDCISSSSFSILVKSKPTRVFKSGRGLRQGDPLSPTLFILMFETLSQSFHTTINSKYIIEGTSSMGHLVFADNLLDFMKANWKSINEVKKIVQLWGLHWTE